MTAAAVLWLDPRRWREAVSRSCALALRTKSLALTISVFALGLSPTVVAAQADEQQGCSEEHLLAQRARKEGKLLAAREHLLACSRELCMDVIEKDCATWLQEIDASLPSVVVVARDPWGDETLNVRVLVDGEVVREELDAHAIRTDPGQHLFRFETKDAPPVERTLIVREGEQNQRIEVKFSTGTASAGVLDSERAAPPGAPKEGGGISARDLGWVLGTVGATSFVGGSLFWISSSAAVGDLEDSGCKPNCPAEFTDGIERQRLIGDVMAVVGIASIGAAVYLLVWGPGATDDPKTARRIEFRAERDGTRVTVAGRF